MNDSISRQDAIDLVSQHTFYDDYEDTDKFCLIDGLKNLPSTQPERKTGRWIIKKSMMYCSECGDGFDVGNYHDFKFCPNCGCRMEGDDDET